VVATTSEVKEVFGDMKQLAAFNILTELLLHFADDGSRCCLADFDSATRQGPVGVTWSSVKQYMSRIDNDRGGSNLEALTVKLH